MKWHELQQMTGEPSHFLCGTESPVATCSTEQNVNVGSPSASGGTRAASFFPWASPRTT